MKIGLLTFHRAHNYGAVLQCYALQEYLESLGHDVCVIDYRQPHIEQLYKPRLNLLVVAKKICFFRFKELRLYIKRYLSMKLSKKNFGSFREKYLKCTIKCNAHNIPNNFDCYIVGSDQVWSFNCCGGYDPVYWGSFIKAEESKLVGYAISSNGDYHKYLSEEEIKTHVAHFDNLSFREETICLDINSITGNNFCQTIDPTLLTSSRMWDSLLNKEWCKRKYIVVYQVRFLETNKSIIPDKAASYAQLHGYELIDLSSMKYSVEDFVSIICYAKGVFTSSFHAIVFSIIFKTPFVAFKLNDRQDDRYINLLHNLNLGHHLKSIQESDFQSILEDEICVGEDWDIYRQKSIDFLKEM